MKPYTTTLRHLGVACLLLILYSSAHAQITSTQALIKAINNGSENDVVTVGVGTFKLDSSLQPKSGMVIQGAGVGQTIIMPSDSWTPSDTLLPDGDTDHTSVVRDAYMFDLGDKTRNVTIKDATLSGQGKLHGILYGNDCDGLELSTLQIRDVIWSGVRTFRMENALIHEVDFLNAGGQFGVTGGALYLTWTGDSEIWNNRFTKDDGDNFYGIKGRQFKNVRIHHNTILMNFAIELPFENDEFVEIDHNVCDGAISIPKYGGGPVPEDGYSFHIHHNLMYRAYSLEWARNGAEVDHNLFDFDIEDDKGNLIGDFGRTTSPGPTLFHDNLISNPGRGLIWTNSPYNNYSFYNNHVRANKTVTPRTDGLFGFSKNTDFSTIVIKDNIIECYDLNRPLLRNEESREATIVNNTLIGISDTEDYENPQTDAKKGLLEPLKFTCGAYDEYTVDGWQATKTDGIPEVSTTIVVYAGGRTNEETMELRIDGQAVTEWTNVGGSFSGDFVAYSYTADEEVVASQIQVAFTNDDGASRDLRVDKIEVDGVAYQSEAPTTYSTGTWTSDNGCGGGFKRNEWLHCDGYFAYDQTNARTADAGKKQTIVTPSEEVRLFPNPAQNVLRVRLPSREGEVVITLTDLMGREVLQHRQTGSQPVDLPVQTLPKGLYQVRVQQAGQQTIQKLLVE